MAVTVYYVTSTSMLAGEASLVLKANALRFVIAVVNLLSKMPSQRQSSTLSSPGEEKRGRGPLVQCVYGRTKFTALSMFFLSSPLP